MAGTPTLFGNSDEKCSALSKILARKGDMKDHLCWICMQDFSSGTQLLKHETSSEHLELLFAQATGREKDSREKRSRDGKRRSLAGLEEEVEMSEDERRRRLFDDDAADSTRQILSFCRCILGWRLGECSECLILDEDIIRARIFASAVETEVFRTETLERRATIKRVLSVRSSHFDSAKRRMAPETCASEPGSKWLQKLRPNIAIRHFRRIAHFSQSILGQGETEEEMRQKSPLLPSKARRNKRKLFPS